MITIPGHDLDAADERGRALHVASAPQSSPLLLERFAKVLELPESQWTDRLVIEAAVELVRRYKKMCGRLQAAVQEFKLGLGGEPVDRLVIDELRRLRSRTRS